MSESLEALVDFVNDQLQYNERCVEKFGKNPHKSSRHAVAVAAYRHLLAIITAPPAQPVTSASSELRSEIAPRQLRLWLLPDEVENLPDELMQELSAASVDKTELAIFGILEKRGGIASLDQILVGLYRATGEVHRRTTLTSRLYRMTQRKQVFSVPNKKGVYANREITETEAIRLFGELDETTA